jgi:hypothetical protein
MGRKHWPVFLLISLWSLVLLVPVLRLLTSRLIVDAIEPTSTANRSLFDFNVASLVPSLSRLAASKPQDVHLQQKLVDWRHAPIDKAELQEYDRLIQRFPHNPFLLANRLRLGAMWLHPLRPSTDAPVAKRQSETPNLKAPRNYSDYDVRQAMVVAEAGRRIEPDNCFFDLELAQLQLLLEEDTQAIQTLRGASLKARYDDHTREDARITLEVARQCRPLLTEDRMALVAGQLLPHLAGHYVTARIAVAHGVQAERAGDYATALDIYASIARIGALMQESQGSSTVLPAGLGIEILAWQGARPNAMLEQPVATPESIGVAHQALVKLLRDFQNFALQHNRRDIADETSRLGRKALSYQEESSAWSLFFVSGVGSGLAEPEILSGMTMLSWSATMVLSQIVLAVAVWLVVSGVLFYFRDKTYVSCVDGAAVAVVFAGLTAGLVYAGIATNAHLVTYQNPGKASLSPEYVGRLQLAAALLPLGLGVIGAIIAQMWHFRKLPVNTPMTMSLDRWAGDASSGQSTSALKYANWTLSLVTIACCYAALMGMAYPSPNSSWVVWLPVCCGLLLICLMRSVAQWQAAGSHGARLRLIALHLLAIVGLLSWLLACVPVGQVWFANAPLFNVLQASSAAEALAILHFYSAPFALLFTAAYALVWLSRYMRISVPVWRRTKILYGLQWLRQAIGAYIVLASVAYFGLLLLSLPGRYRVDKQLDTLVSSGQMALFKQFSPSSHTTQDSSPAD